MSTTSTTTTEVVVRTKFIYMTRQGLREIWDWAEVNHAVRFTFEDAINLVDNGRPSTPHDLAQYVIDMVNDEVAHGEYYSLTHDNNVIVERES